MRATDLGRRKFIKSLLLATLGTGTVSGEINQHEQLAVSSTGWSTFAHDPQNTGHNPETSVPAELNRQWTREIFTAGRIIGRGNKIYVSQLDGSIQARSAATGEVNWTSDYPTYGTGLAPTVTSDTVYAGGYEDLYALSASDGSTIWSTGIPADGTATTVVNGMVFAGGRDGVIYALDASTGDEQWTFDTGSTSSGTFDAVPEPAFAAGTVYIGGGYDNNKVYALSANEGVKRWEKTLSAAVMAPPTVDSDTLYVNSTDGRVHALDTDEGSEVWTYETSDITYASPSIANGTVVVGSLDQTLYALDASDGSEQWNVNLENAIGVSPVIADGSILVQFTDGSVAVRSLADGSEQETAPSAHIDGFSDVLNNIIVFNNQVFSHRHGSLRKFAKNIPPTASISIEPESADMGEEITFSAEASSDEDGTIESYQWDLTGDQEFNQTGDVQTKTYSSDGTYNIHLRIVDSDGAQGSAQDAITIEPGDQPPKPSFTISPSNPAPNETITLDGSESVDDGSITKYEWDLDGDESYEENGQSIETSFSSTGEIPIKLRVTDDAGNTDTIVEDVSVSSGTDTPTAEFSYSPQNPVSGETVTLDATDSTAETSMTSYDWDVTGDGNYDQQGETITESFETGEAEVTLRVTDESDQTDTTSRTVSIGATNSPPTAAFDFSPEAPTAGEAVSFDASASADDGPVDSYEWDLDDDGTAEKTRSQLEYTFDTSGEYPVTLRVSNDAGESTETQTVSVSRDNAPPTAAFTYTPEKPTTADKIEFDASSSSDDEGIMAYEWDFTGDGVTDATGQTATYNFETATKYDVILTVRDGDGATRSISQTVTITESPFQQTKEAHLSTAREVQDATAGDLGVVEQAEAANQSYTRAVKAGAIDSNTAFKAIQRLNTGIETTATVAKQIGSAPELGGDNDRDLTRKMAKPTIDTAVQLTTMIATASSQSGSDSGGLVGAIKKDLIEGIKSDAKDAIKNLIRTMLGNALTRFTRDFESAGETLASEILSEAVSTATEIENRLDELKDQILGLIADALQRRAEKGFAFTPAPLLATNLAAYAGTLNAGVLGLYTLLDAESVRDNGLAGTTADALAESNGQRKEIRSQTRLAENLIDDAIEFGENSNLASVLAGFSDGIGIIDILRGISTVVRYFIAGIPTAFAAGAGIGSLIEINIRHHVSMYTAIQGDSL